jgi:hypothetical protein
VAANGTYTDVAKDEAAKRRKAEIDVTRNDRPEPTSEKTAKTPTMQATNVQDTAAMYKLTIAFEQLWYMRKTFVSVVGKVFIRAVLFKCQAWIGSNQNSVVGLLQLTFEDPVWFEVEQ